MTLHRNELNSRRRASPSWSMEEAKQARPAICGGRRKELMAESLVLLKMEWRRRLSDLSPIPLRTTRTSSWLMEDFSTNCVNLKPFPSFLIDDVRALAEGRAGLDEAPSKISQ